MENSKKYSENFDKDDKTPAGLIPLEEENGFLSQDLDTIDLLVADQIAYAEQGREKEAIERAKSAWLKRGVNEWYDIYTRYQHSRPIVSGLLEASTDIFAQVRDGKINKNELELFLQKVTERKKELELWEDEVYKVWDSYATILRAI